MNNKYENLELEKDNNNSLEDRFRREQINKQVISQDKEISKTTNAMKKSAGASDALRKYELAKRDYEKASVLGKAYLKLTGQANFKKMLAEANQGMNR